MKWIIWSLRRNHEISWLDLQCCADKKQPDVVIELPLKIMENVGNEACS